MTTVGEVAGECGLAWMPVTVGMPPPHDAAGAWRRLHVLTSPEVLGSHLAVVQAECDGLRDVASAFVAARFASPLARLAVVPVITRNLVLDFAPAELWLRRDRRGLITGVRVGTARLTDPGGSVSSAHAVAPAVTGYRLVVAGLREVGALGERALWGQLADTLVATVGQTLDADTAPDTAAETAGRWLRGADPPLWVDPVFARVVVAGTPRLVWRRGSCCLAYRLPQFGLCTGCPLQSRADWLAAASVP